jgi:hypothetical protein
MLCQRFIFADSDTKHAESFDLLAILTYCNGITFEGYNNENKTNFYSPC